MHKMQRKRGLRAPGSSALPSATGQGGSGMGGGVSRFGPGTSGCPAAGSFLSGEPPSSSCRKQKEGEMCEDQGLRDAPAPAGSTFRLGGWGAYRFGRSCRSFFTQRASGSTQTLSRLFSLILENTRGFSTVASSSSSGRGEQPSPPPCSSSKEYKTEIIQEGWGGGSRGLLPHQEPLTPPRGAGSCSPPARPRCC